MDSKDYWTLFLETGAPEFYMLYKGQKTEGIHVSDGEGSSDSGHGLQ